MQNMDTENQLNTQENDIISIRKKSWGDFFSRYEQQQSLDKIIQDFVPDKIDQPFRNIPGAIIALMHRIEIQLHSKLFEYYIAHEEGKMLEEEQATTSAYNEFTKEIKRLANEGVSAQDCTKYLLYRLEVSDHADLCSFVERKFGLVLKDLLLKRKTLVKTKNRKLKTKIATEWRRIKRENLKTKYLIQYAKLILKNN